MQISKALVFAQGHMNTWNEWKFILGHMGWNHAKKEDCV